MHGGWPEGVCKALYYQALSGRAWRVTPFWFGTPSKSRCLMNAEILPFLRVESVELDPPTMPVETNVTDAGVQPLKQSLPNLTITR